MESTITEEMLRVKSPPMADWLEFSLAVRVDVLIRFGRWDELKKLPIPDDKELYCITIAMRQSTCTTHTPGVSSSRWLGNVCQRVS